MKSYKASFIICGFLFIGVLCLWLYTDNLDSYVKASSINDTENPQLILPVSETPLISSDQHLSIDEHSHDPLRVRAIGSQFKWTFHYAGEDGKFGSIKHSLVSANDPVVLDFNDEKSLDDFLSDCLILAANQPVIVQTRSLDVIHNFSITQLKIQQDAIPNKDIPMWFTPIKKFNTEVVCGPLCGSGHEQMKAKMSVISSTDFIKWMSKQTPLSKRNK